MRRVNVELEAEIIRLHLAEKWPIGTIATQLEVHHSSVRRVLQRAGLPLPPSPAKRGGEQRPLEMRETALARS